MGLVYDHDATAVRRCLMKFKRLLIPGIAGVICTAVLLSTAPAFAVDKIHILDGGIVEGYIIEENDDYVLIRRKSGDIQEINQDEIDWIEHGPAFKDELKRKWKEVKSKDADALFELGLWCEDRGHPEEVTRCFEKVISLNPNHAVAREKLGHMYYDGTWYENIEKYYEARGYVNYKNNWIPKGDKAKYEAGLVKQEDGTWISRKKLEELKKRPKPSDPKVKKPPKKTKDDKDPKKEKKPWKRQTRDDAFYEDFSGEVPWANRHRYESKHYLIESNCSMKHIKRYAKMLDAVYQKYCKVFGKPKSPRKCNVRIYARQQQMGRGGGVGGFYGGGRVTVYHGKFGRTGSTQTVLFHECTHQFHDMVAGIRKAQIWFTEGLAVFFECSEVDENGKIHIGVVNKDRLGTVQKGVKGGSYINLNTLLSTPQSGFSGRHYAYAWTVIYFLVYTNRNNRKVFNRYWGQVCCGSGESRGSPKFKKMIGIPLQDLEDCWKEWVQMLDKDDLPEEVEVKSKEFFKTYKKKK
jgi:tetratricopeptide (TPR) repeat protein